MLIVGGTSSLAPEIVDKFSKIFNKITCTYRNKNKIFNKNVAWEYLDLEKDKSIDAFLDKNADNKYDTVIVLVGAVTDKKYIDFDLDSLKKYYSIHSASYLYLVQNLTKNLEKNGKIIVVSSRSANNPSYDVHYSGVKAAIQAAVMSMSRFLDSEQSIVCVSPSLIADSKMFNDMTEENIKKHMYLSNNNLVTTQEFAEFIATLDSKMTKLINGKTISIGNY